MRIIFLGMPALLLAGCAGGQADVQRKFPDMEHDEPCMAHVAPGKQGELVWQFTQPGEFYYGCLVPGHFEAGMVGKVRVTP